MIYEILEMKAPENSRDIIVHSPHCTPALSAAVASANPPEMILESDEEEEEEELKPIKIKGVLYYLDGDNTAYTETEDGYEEVGKYDPVKNVVEVDDEEEEGEATGSAEGGESEEGGERVGEASSTSGGERAGKKKKKRRAERRKGSTKTKKGGRERWEVRRKHHAELFSLAEQSADGARRGRRQTT